MIKAVKTVPADKSPERRLQRKVNCQRKMPTSDTQEQRKRRDNNKLLMSDSL